MPFSVDEFRAEVNRQGGLARNSNFRMLMTGNVLKSSSARALAMLLNSAQIPGRSLATQDIITHGPMVKHPYLSIYDDLSVNIYCTNNNLFPRDLFEEWQNLIVNGGNHRLNYFDQFVCDMEIEQFDQEGNVTFACKFIDAYPVAVAPLDLNWGGNEVHNLNVQFAFRRWHIQPLPLSPFGNNLAINALYPNFDVGGIIDNFGLGVLNRADGQFLSGVKRSGQFLTNII